MEPTLTSHCPWLTVAGLSRPGASVAAPRNSWAVTSPERLSRSEPPAARPPRAPPPLRPPRCRSARGSAARRSMPSRPRRRRFMHSLEKVPRGSGVLLRRQRRLFWVTFDPPAFRDATLEYPGQRAPVLLSVDSNIGRHVELGEGLRE